MFKKIILSLVVGSFLFSSFVIPVVNAQAQPPQDTSANWWDPTLGQFQQKVNQGDPNDIFGERYTYAQVTWVVMSLITIIQGHGLTSCSGSVVQAIECIRTNLDHPTTSSIDSPMLAFGVFSDTLLETKPVSGIAWARDTASKLSIIPVANAADQGAGFDALSIIQPLWKASRDFSYALMTLAIVGLAFMVMFRVKLSPQVTISIQSAIPKVVIGLILITFSYAIAGFIIDLAYLAQGIVALMFTSSGISVLKDSAGNVNPVEVFKQINNAGGGLLSMGVAYTIVIGLMTGIVFLAGFVPPLAPISAILSVGGIVVLVIVVIAFIVATFKIFWTLLRTYISVVMAVVVVPFYILLGVVSPSVSFSGWLKSFVANVSVFPVMGILVLLAHFLFWSTVSLGTIDSGPISQFINPFQIKSIVASTTGITGLPSFGGGVNPAFIGFAGSLVVLMSASSIANSVKEVIASGRTKGAELGTGFIGASGGYAVGALNKQYSGKLAQQAVGAARTAWTSRGT